MTAELVSVSEVFGAHGIVLSEREALDLIDEALAAVSGAPEAAALPPDEAAIYDAVGMRRDPDALVRQTRSVAKEFVHLLATALPVTAAAARLGVTRSRLQQMVSAREVWAIRGNSQWALPVAQFDGDALLPGWSKVARELPRELHPLEILGFLTTAQPELTLRARPRSVLDWLRSGGSPDPAARLARELASGSD